MPELETAMGQKLEQCLKQLNLPASDKQKKQLIKLVELLNKWNKAYNLTSVRDPMEMMVRHIADSIALVAQLPAQKNYIDVGTGPGLPGLPLAIMMPDSQFTLLDSLGKRIRFIKQSVFELGLENVNAIQSRAEEYQDHNGFDGVLSRAFASIDDMLTWCEHLAVKPQGKFFAMKGIYPKTELDTLLDKFEVVNINALQVPFLNEDRHLVEIVIK